MRCAPDGLGPPRKRLPLVRKKARFTHDMTFFGRDVRRKRFKRYRRYLQKPFVPRNVLDGTKCVAKGILCNLKRLFGTNDHGTSKAHRGRGDVLMRLAQEDSLVRKNARFAHDMVNSESDVRGKRFSAHAIRVNRDFTLSRFYVEPPALG